MGKPMIFFDLDGTLLLDDHRSVSARTRAALERAHDKGMLLCASTGRCRALVPDAPFGLPLDYLSTSSGAAVYNMHTNERILERVFSREAAQSAWNILKNTPDLFIEWFENGTMSLSKRNNDRLPTVHYPMWHEPFFAQKKQTVWISDDEFILNGAGHLEKINLPPLNTPKEAYDAVCDALDAAGLFAFERTARCGFEVTKKGVGKGSTLEILCDMNHVSVSNSVAFGDSANDLDLLRAAGTGVAMGNAGDRVKQIADAVTDTNINDGIAVFLEKNVL